MTFTPNAGNDALGFFMTDPNDSGGRFSINGEGFNFEDVFGSRLGSGSVFYISLYDSAGLTNVEVYANSESDGYGIDNVTVGEASKVPEPGALSLMGLGLLGLGMGYRRRS